MVGLLSVVGLVTGVFYFTVRDIYGTIVFHNFLAVTGVTRALADSGRLSDFETPQWPLLLTAVTALLLLTATDLTLVRSAASVGSDSSYSASEPG